jgi:predicted ester cyclase
MSEANKDLIRRYQEAYNSGDLDALDEILAPDWFSNSWPRELMEQSVENAKALHGVRLEAIPDLMATTECLIAEGDWVVQRLTERGTHKGDVLGLPPTGNSVESGAVSLFRIADGRIVEHWAFQDTLPFFEQCGAQFPPEWSAFAHRAS